MKLKYRQDGSLVTVPIQTPIASTWVSIGNLNGGDLIGYDIDLSILGYTAEPQVWFQPYRCSCVASIYQISPTYCRLWAYNPTGASTTVQRWLKTCEYFSE